MDNNGDCRREREEIGNRCDELRKMGICPTCRDLRGGGVFGPREPIYEDDLVKIVLESYPRVRGHTIVIYKPHAEDISQLPDEDLEPLLAACVRMIRALKQALGAEKVYLNTMCDGDLNHLHLQLFPRYPGEKIGSTRFVLERHKLEDEVETTRMLRAALPEEMRV